MKIDEEAKKKCNLAKMELLFFSDEPWRIKYKNAEEYTEYGHGYPPSIDSFRINAMSIYSKLVRDLQKFIIAGYDYNEKYRATYDAYFNFSLYVFNTFRRTHYKIPTYREYITDLCSQEKWDEFINANHLNGEVEYDQDVRDGLVKEWGNFEY